jgi:death-on-curing protein
MITLEKTLAIHHILIEKYGGSKGVRDLNLLKSAIQRPYSGIGDTEFYPLPEEKAAAILESIIKNHPFIDGNKRVGYVLMRLVLMQHDKDIKASQDAKYEFVMSIASGILNFEDITIWIKNYMVDNENI